MTTAVDLDLAYLDRLNSGNSLHLRMAGASATDPYEFFGRFRSHRSHPRSQPSVFRLASKSVAAGAPAAPEFSELGGESDGFPAAVRTVRAAVVCWGNIK